MNEKLNEKLDFCFGHQKNRRASRPIFWTKQMDGHPVYFCWMKKIDGNVVHFLFWAGPGPPSQARAWAQAGPGSSQDLSKPAPRAPPRSRCATCWPAQPAQPSQSATSHPSQPASQPAHPACSEFWRSDHCWRLEFQHLLRYVPFGDILRTWLSSHIVNFELIESTGDFEQKNPL